MEFKKGQRIKVDGFTDELWIEGYHVRVCSEGTVVERTRPKDKKVLVMLDEIDGEGGATVRIRKSKVRPAD